jgi:hypothetical protein
MIITFEFLFGYMYILRNFGAEKKTEINQISSVI